MIKWKKLNVCFFCLYSLLATSIAMAGEMDIGNTGSNTQSNSPSNKQDTDLREEINAYVLGLIPQSSNTGIQVEVMDLDPRFKISACGIKLTLAATQEITPESLAGRHNIKVRCENTHAWSIYVPITINVWKEIPTVISALKRGDSIRLQDIVMKRQNVTKLQGRYLDNLDQISGKVITRSVAAGTALYPELLLDPDLIKKGDVVVLVFKTGAVTVSASGTAKQSGKQGDQISVENLTSKRTLSGRVIDKSTVSLTL